MRRSGDFSCKNKISSKYYYDNQNELIAVNASSAWSAEVVSSKEVDLREPSISLKKSCQTRPYHVRPKISVRAYRFQFKGVITCSSCGCGIGAGYHPKVLADGSTKIYVHYACNNNGHNTRRKCHLHGGVSETSLFKQVDALLNKYRISRTLYDWALEILRDLKDEEIYERHSI